MRLVYLIFVTSLSLLASNNQLGLVASGQLLGRSDHHFGLNSIEEDYFEDAAYGEDIQPVVFIPGDGGSQLQARLNKTSRVHYICDLTSDWYDLWLNIHLLAPLLFDCLVDNMRLNFDHRTNLTYNSQGVDIRPTNFGSLASVAYLDVLKIPKTDYFETIIKTLEQDHNLIRETEMVGAAFDFRKAPNELHAHFEDLKYLIESTYIRNGYRPVNLICHSMGCLNSLYLLNRQTQNWKDIFVRRLIALAAPWDGSMKAISAMLFGDNLGIPLLNKEKLQYLQSSFPSLMYLFPKAPTFGSGRVLVETKDVNYTLDNLDKLFDATGLLDQKAMWLITKEIAASLSPPNVELWCLYGSGNQTPNKIVFEGSLEDGKYREIQGDGDGTVNIESSRACERFSSMQAKPVYVREFEGVDHIDILRGEQAANFISNHILRDNSINPK